MKSTIYDIVDHTWKDITLIGADLITYRLGHTLLPMYNENRIADRVLVFGGVDVSSPIENNKELCVLTLDFKAAQDFNKI